MQFLKWIGYLILGTAVAIFAVGAWLLFSLVGAIIGVISLGSAVALLLGLVISSLWQARSTE